MKYACMLSIRFGTPCNKLVSGDFASEKYPFFAVETLKLNIVKIADLPTQS